MSAAPQMLTIRQCAQRGPLSEYALRLMEKQGKLPCMLVGNALSTMTGSWNCWEG